MRPQSTERHRAGRHADPAGRVTLFVLSSTRLSTGNLRIVGNMQARKAVDATAQQTIEQVLSWNRAFL
jgi:DNA-binding transcriptional regulator YbjK